MQTVELVKPRLGLVILSLLLARVSAAQSPAPAAASPNPARPSYAPVDWRRRIPLDSGEMYLEVTPRAAAITVVAPTGTFLQAFATTGPLIEWVDSATALAAPGGVADLVRGGGNPTMFTLARAVGDSAGAYVLTGTNGAWDFALVVRASQLRALAGALRGDTPAGAIPYEGPRMSRTRDGDLPLFSGAWLTNQVDREAAPGRRPPRPAYPSSLRSERPNGIVELQFTIDSTGRVPPRSVRVIGTPHPAFAIAARDAVLSARYTPAQRDGKPVAQLASQQFAFVAP